MNGEGLLGKLKERDIMAAIVTTDGTQVASNFGLHGGVESYAASAFNVGDALLREAGEEARELMVTTDRGNLVLRKVDQGILLCLIKTKDQYAFYKGLLETGGVSEEKPEERAAPPKEEEA